MSLYGGYVGIWGYRLFEDTNECVYAACGLLKLECAL